MSNSGDCLFLFFGKQQETWWKILRVDCFTFQWVWLRLCFVCLFFLIFFFVPVILTLESLSYLNECSKNILNCDIINKLNNVNSVLCSGPTFPQDQTSEQLKWRFPSGDALCSKRCFALKERIHTMTYGQTTLRKPVFGVKQIFSKLLPHTFPNAWKKFALKVFFFFAINTF